VSISIPADKFVIAAAKLVAFEVRLRKSVEANCFSDASLLFPKLIASIKRIKFTHMHGGKSGQYLGKCALQKYLNQVALVVGTAFQIVYRIGGLGQSFCRVR
jgi:hypothetical protein